MTSQLGAIREGVSGLCLEQALLFLNHVLAVSRRDIPSRYADCFRRRHKILPAPFVVHFLAKEVLKNASEIGIQELDWRRFEYLYSLYFELDDPILHDPNWKTADPSGFLERQFSQQFPAQRLNFAQRFGLAQGLFGGLITEMPLSVFDLRAATENAIGMSIDDYMGLGFLTHSLCNANILGHKCQGTFRYIDLADAFAQGINFSGPEVWAPFLERVSCTPAEFRIRSNLSEHCVEDELFYPFEFNLLRRFPIIRLSCDRFIAPDPNLLLDRVSTGLFFDNLSLDKRRNGDFLQAFGHTFSRLVGEMLESTMPHDQVLCLDSVEQQLSTKSKGRSAKIGDWLVTGDLANVVLECKSLRPSVELTTYGAETSMV